MHVWAGPLHIPYMPRPSRPRNPPNGSRSQVGATFPAADSPPSVSEHGLAWRNPKIKQIDFGSERLNGPQKFPPLVASTLATTWTSRVTNRAVTTEPSPQAIGGQSSMAWTNASPETSSSGRLSGSIRPAHRPLANIHERGRMISASTMPPSLRSTVIDNLAQVAWSGSGCGSTSKRLGFLVRTRDQGVKGHPPNGHVDR
jgi:hypothetical protein